MYYRISKNAKEEEGDYNSNYLLDGTNTLSKVVAIPYINIYVMSITDIFMLD